MGYRAAVRNSAVLISRRSLAQMFVVLQPFVQVPNAWIPASLRLCVFLSYFYPLKSVEMTVVATEHDLSLKFILVSDELHC